MNSTIKKWSGRMIDILIKSIVFVHNFGVHSLQTAFLSSRIAEILQLDPVEAFYSGIFHDIGMITPHNGIALDDVNYRYLTNRDLTSNEIGINEHALMSSFEVSKLSKLTKTFPNISSNILLHHASAKYLDSSQKSDIMANIIFIADVMSLYTINNQEEMNFEDFKTSLWPTKERYFDFVYEAALAAIKEDYTRWMLYDIKSGNNKELVVNDFTFNEKYSFEDALETGSILSYIIDSKSSFTRDHSWRVARIASAIAKEIMLDDEDFFIAGLFHDIGKIITPIEILEKKGKLNEREMDIMRKHVYYSYSILSNHKDEPWFLPAVRHQERIDGSGYPLRLTGDKMTFKDKTLQVADYFAAVLEPRPYRSANSPEQAYEEIAKAVSNGVLDKSPANILKGLVFGGYDFSNLDFTSQIQIEISNFEETVVRKRTKDNSSKAS